MNTALSSHVILEQLPFLPSQHAPPETTVAHNKLSKLSPAEVDQTLRYLLKRNGWVHKAVHSSCMNFTRPTHATLVLLHEHWDEVVDFIEQRSSISSRRYLLSSGLGLPIVWSDVAGMDRLDPNTRVNSLYLILHFVAQFYRGLHTVSPEVWQMVGVATSHNAYDRVTKYLRDNWAGADIKPSNLVDPDKIQIYAASLLSLPAKLSDADKDKAYVAEMIIMTLCGADEESARDRGDSLSPHLRPGNVHYGGRGGGDSDARLSRAGLLSQRTTDTGSKILQYTRRLAEFLHRVTLGLWITFETVPGDERMARIVLPISPNSRPIIQNLDKNRAYFPLDVFRISGIPHGTPGIIAWRASGFAIRFYIVGQEEINLDFDSSLPNHSFFPPQSSVTLRRLSYEITLARSTPSSS
ncbi:hypothetical protein JCM5353_005627 [Sporobolomyces roseus]